MDNPRSNPLGKPLPSNPLERFRLLSQASGRAGRAAVLFFLASLIGPFVALHSLHWSINGALWMHGIFFLIGCRFGWKWLNYKRALMHDLDDDDDVDDGLILALRRPGASYPSSTVKILPIRAASMGDVATDLVVWHTLLGFFDGMNVYQWASFCGTWFRYEGIDHLIDTINDAHQHLVVGPFRYIADAKGPDGLVTP